ncbi:MAG: PadR family transcriptional regulator [Candidatus Woesearchaeota archaeon]
MLNKEKKIDQINSQGYLRIMVLAELNKNPSTGYDLMKNLSLHLKKKPSPGSIYPLLSELHSENLISVKEEGRKKIYELTKKGKKSIALILSEKEKSLIEHIKLMMHFSKNISKDCISKAEKLKKEMLNNPKFLSDNIKDWEELRNIALDLLLDKNYENKKDEIKKVIKETVNKLKEIKKK